MPQLPQLDGDCHLCDLRKGCKQVVWGNGPHNALLWLIGEGPGAWEDRTGKPFVGDAGQELDHYLQRAGIARDKCYVDNVVKCRPPNNRDPKSEEVATCTGAHLMPLIMRCKPQFIGALGVPSAKWFLGEDLDMGKVHGIPYYWNPAPINSERYDLKGGIIVLPDEVTSIVIPMYHPAAGLHQTEMMTRIMGDFESLARVVRGESRVRIGGVEDEYPEPHYSLVREI